MYNNFVDLSIVFFFFTKLVKYEKVSNPNCLPISEVLRRTVR